MENNAWWLCHGTFFWKQKKKTAHTKFYTMRIEGCFSVWNLIHWAHTENIHGFFTFFVSYLNLQFIQWYLLSNAQRIGFISSIFNSNRFFPVRTTFIHHMHSFHLRIENKSKNKSHERKRKIGLCEHLICHIQIVELKMKLLIMKSKRKIKFK